MSQGTFLLPLILSLIAGLSTGIGSLISLVMKKVEGKHLAFFLGFSAGVMIYISFVELLTSSFSTAGFIVGNLAFFAGIILFMAIDYFIPHNYLAEKMHCNKKEKKIFSATLLITIGIIIHNFPEGLAVLVTTWKDIKLAIPLTFAIAIHNIPEGIAIAVPIFYLTKSRRKSFIISLLSGVTEPLGAIAGYFLLKPFINDYNLAIILAMVAGIMVFISFDELLPICYENGKGHLAILGILMGMVVMASSLYLL